MEKPEDPVESHWTVEAPTHRPFWLYLVTIGAAIALITTAVIGGVFLFALFLMSTHFYE